MAIPRRLFGPAALTNAAADTYTVPAARRCNVRQIHVVNTSAVDVPFTASVGADAPATRIADAKVVPAHDYIDLFFNPLELVAAEKIQAFGGTTLVLTMTIMGEEELI